MAGKGQAPLHTLERRSALLAQKLTGRMSDLTQSLRAAEGRIPFHTKMTRSTALDWWGKHRYDELGQQALAGLSQAAIINLDTNLAQYAHQRSITDLPVESGQDVPPAEGDNPGFAGDGGFNG